MNRKIFGRLLELYDRLPDVRLSRNDRVVIFSDLHMGDGGRHDDFLNNSRLFQTILENHYDREKYRLVLNGDIEELQRFSGRKIYRRWKDLYGVFQRFQARNALFKTIGNHDYELFYRKPCSGIPVRPGIRFRLDGYEFLVFHGFQAHRYPRIYYVITTLILRLLANPLGIKNYSVAYDSQKKYTVEKRVYRFAKHQKAIAIIGHTHRPLFESLSKVDTLKFNIEKLCRLYPGAGAGEKKKLRKKLMLWKQELTGILEADRRHPHRDVKYLYDAEPLVPCIFNSGCVIGRRGITAIEITGKEIRLVYWYDQSVKQKIFDFHDNRPRRLGKSNYFRLVLKREDLDYIFTRVMLLS